MDAPRVTGLIIYAIITDPVTPAAIYVKVIRTALTVLENFPFFACLWGHGNFYIPRSIRVGWLCIIVGIGLWWWYKAVTIVVKWLWWWYRITIRIRRHWWCKTARIGIGL